MTTETKIHYLHLELERLTERAELVAAAAIALEEAATGLLPDHPLTSMLVDQLQAVQPAGDLKLIEALAVTIANRAAQDAADSLSTGQGSAA